MKNTFLDKALRRLGLARLVKRDASVVGGVYAGGRVNRLTQDWVPSTQTGDAAIRNDLRLLRSRCRDLERDDDYVRKYLGSLESNVLGHQGISLEMKAVNPDGTPDKVANRVIAKGWEQWGRSENCTLSQDDDWFDVQSLVLRSCVRDGGILFRKIRQRDVNEFGFTLQMLEIDYLDINYSVPLPNGNYVFMGIEKTADTRRIVGYWLLQRHPGETFFGAWPYARYFVPAEEIIHYFIKERASQSVGVPLFCSPMTRLNMLRGYEEAELVASREAAQKGGFFRSKSGDQYAGEKKNDGSTLDDMEPGQKTELPAGMDFIPYNPTHPTSQYPEHVKAQLRGVAAGLQISYSTLTGDLSEVNFSSGRMGWLEEREFFKRLQSHLTRKFVLKVFEPWLEQSLLAGVLDVQLPFSKFKQFNAPFFRGRRWPWVDPLKDVQAALEAINGGLETRTQHIEEHADRSTFEETIEQLEYEKEMQDKAGLVFTAPTVKTVKDDQTQEEPAAKTKPSRNGSLVH